MTFTIVTLPDRAGLDTQPGQPGNRDQGGVKAGQTLDATGKEKDEAAEAKNKHGSVQGQGLRGNLCAFSGRKHPRIVSPAKWLLTVSRTQPVFYRAKQTQNPLPLTRERV